MTLYNEMCIRDRYRSRLDIHYFSSGFKKNADISEVSEKLYLVLEYIETDCGLIRGTGINEERVDGVLQFIVDYSVVTRREKGKDPYMEMCIRDRPKSIAEIRSYGINAIGAKKGPDSVEYGIKWLQDLEEIVIDPVRCPETFKEFNNYELEPDGDDGFTARFHDKNLSLIHI